MQKSKAVSPSLVSRLFSLLLLPFYMAGALVGLFTKIRPTIRKGLLIVVAALFVAYRALLAFQVEVPENTDVVVDTGDAPLPPAPPLAPKPPRGAPQVPFPNLGPEQTANPFSGSASAARPASSPVAPGSAPSQR